MRRVRYDRSATPIGKPCWRTTHQRLAPNAVPCSPACADACPRLSSWLSARARWSALCSAVRGDWRNTSVRSSPRTKLSPARWLVALWVHSTDRCLSIWPTRRRECVTFWTHAASMQCDRSPGCFTGRPAASMTPHAPSRWSAPSLDDVVHDLRAGRSDASARDRRERSIQLRRMDWRHLDVFVQELVGIGGPDVVRLFHLQIFVDKLVIVSHPFVVMPAERHGARGLVVHQHRDEVPIIELVLIKERAVGFDQRFDAGIRGLGAIGERLLRDLHELVGLVPVGLEPGAIGDDR